MMINQQSIRPKIVTKTNDSSNRTTRQAGKKYRSKIQIIGEILSSVSSHTGGLTKTKIMYRSYLSYAQVKDYLSSMLTDNLLTFNQSTFKFTVTDKGFKFLQNY
ncbi:MAG: winged helix-turn-helix domain-containing protein [Candidatus Nitrosocosmicus sp.]|nr:winged helix-turn-helix domain-containing protein [Candidatus Nitrosocosmicus sp.]